MLVSHTSTPPRPQRRTLVATSAGNFVEYFDWGVYATFTSYFSTQFFGRGDDVGDLLKTLAVFAVGFLMRPLGGWILGSLADRVGRRIVMLISVGAMAGGSRVIAVTPSRVQIGDAAGAILLAARIIQGLAIGGEFGTAAAYMSEVSPRDQRGYFGSFQYLTVILGTLAANLLGFVMSVVLTQDQLQTWGWRIAFGLGAVLGLVAFAFRRGMVETLDKAEHATRAPSEPVGVRALVTTYRAPVLRLLAMTMSTAVVYYIFASFLPTYVITHYKTNSTAAFAASSGALFLLALLQPVVGRASDRFGRRPLLLVYGIGMLVLTFPLTLLLGRSAWSLFFVLAVAYLFFSPYSASSAAVKAELFPNRIRGLGISLPYALASAIFGGTAPYLLAWATSANVTWVFWSYVTVLLAVSLVTFVFMPETAGIDLSGAATEPSSTGRHDDIEPDHARRNPSYEA